MGHHQFEPWDRQYIFVPRVHFIYLGQAKSNTRFKMSIYVLKSLKQLSMFRVKGPSLFTVMCCHYIRHPLYQHCFSFVPPGLRVHLHIVSLLFHQGYVFICILFLFCATRATCSSAYCFSFVPPGLRVHLCIVSLLCHQGYLFISVLVSANNDLMKLVIQNIKNDIFSRNPVHVCLALQCIANIGSREMAEAHGQDIPKLLVSG